MALCDKEEHESPIPRLWALPVTRLKTVVKYCSEWILFTKHKHFAGHIPLLDERVWISSI